MFNETSKYKQPRRGVPSVVNLVNNVTDEKSTFTKHFFSLLLEKPEQRDDICEISERFAEKKVQNIGVISDNIYYSSNIILVI